MTHKMLTFNKSTNTYTSSSFPSTILHGFGTRMSGNGRDTQEIKKYLDQNSYQYNAIIDPEQVHNDRINLVTGENKNIIQHINECDGLITKDRGVVLTVITADCAPIIYSDVKKNIVGISHNGRKGTEMKLSQKMIKQILAMGCELQDLRVAIGPAIGSCCYPINLIEENVRQLLELRISKDQIDTFPFCTKCDSKRFFSYRGSEDRQNFPEQFSFISLSKDIS